MQLGLSVLLLPAEKHRRRHFQSCHSLQLWSFGVIMHALTTGAGNIHEACFLSE